MPKKTAGMSVQAKISAALVGVLILIMLVSMAFTVHSERTLVEKVITRHTHDTADSYFDALNIMMITGTLDNRDILRTKVMSQPGVVDARIVRGEPITRFFGPGRAEEQVKDGLDRRGLQGEDITLIEDTQEGRLLTVIKPIIATSNYRGTNCLTCHVVDEGTIVGAVRISYSLAELDGQIRGNLWRLAGVQLLLFIIGMSLMVFLVRHLIIRPIECLRTIMQQIEEDSDLSLRTQDVQRTDEIGMVSNTFNRMLERFGDSLQQVAGTTQTLQEAAQQISQVSDQTTQAASEQCQGTENVVSAMQQMRSCVQEMMQHAARTSEASQDADSEAQQSHQLTQGAIQGIENLSVSIETATQVINKVGDYSEQVGHVLDMITSIAEQTNLLALNAAIEAARAGEAGRGFAVVADEVRSLANRTHVSTQEVQQTIQQLQQEVQAAIKVMQAANQDARQGVTDVQQVAESIGHITQAVSGINALNSQMAQAAHEQEVVTEEVNALIQSINAIAERTRDDAQSTAQVSDALVSLAQRLDKLVQGFKLH